jgi:hypothetical protein
MLLTKKWNIKIEFDWNAWERLNNDNVKSVISDLIPLHLHNSMVIEIKEEDERNEVV